MLVTSASVDDIIACLTNEDLHWVVRNPGRQDVDPQVVDDISIVEDELLTGLFHSLFHKNNGDWLIRSEEWNKNISSHVGDASVAVVLLGRCWREVTFAQGPHFIGITSNDVINAQESNIIKVLRLVHQDCDISNLAMDLIKSVLGGCLRRISKDGVLCLNAICRYPKKTILSRETQTVVRMMIPDELARHARHAVSEGTKSEVGRNTQKA